MPPLPDVLRVLAVGLFASVLAQALVINALVYASRHRGAVRIPHLLAWHIHAVTVYALGMHAALLLVVLRQLGEDEVLYPLALGALIGLGAVGNVAMLIISRVTAARRRLAAAAE